MNILYPRIEDEGDCYRLWLGNHGHPINKQELRDLVETMRDERQVDLEHIKRNIAIHLALSGVDMNNFAAVKSTIEAKGFRP